MFTIETDKLSPEAAGAASQQFLDNEIAANEALNEAVEAATTGVGTTDELGVPLSSIGDQEADVMKAKDNVKSARQESLAFAEAHMGPLVEAALADAQKDGVSINR